MAVNSIADLHDRHISLHTLCPVCIDIVQTEVLVLVLHVVVSELVLLTLEFLDYLSSY